MWVVKWVEKDDIFNYYPFIRIFADYDKAREFKAEVEHDKMDCSSEDKIVSVIYIEEIKIDEEQS